MFRACRSTRARASFSVALNIAEGSGEFSPKEKARFYRMALRSATECAAVLDVLVRYEAVDPERHKEGRVLVHRLVGTLTRLVNRHTGGPPSRRDAHGGSDRELS
jgi:four helix bundle protein